MSPKKYIVIEGESDGAGGTTWTDFASTMTNMASQFSRPPFNGPLALPAPVLDHTRHSPAGGDVRSRTSTYNSTVRKFDPLSPDYSPTSPKYSPTKEEVERASRQYSPTSPCYSPTSPAYSPAVEGEGSQQSAQYSPTVPDYSPTSPVYGPTSPPYSASDHVDYGPEDPVFSVTSPGYPGGTRSKYSPSGKIGTSQQPSGSSYYPTSSQYKAQSTSRHPIDASTRYSSTVSGDGTRNAPSPRPQNKDRSPATGITKAGPSLNTSGRPQSAPLSSKITAKNAKEATYIRLIKNYDADHGTNYAHNLVTPIDTPDLLDPNFWPSLPRDLKQKKGAEQQETKSRAPNTMADTSIKEGDAAAYSWGGDKKGGTVAEVATEGKVEMETARGNTVAKEAKPKDPAVRLERSGHDVVKNASELTKEGEGESHNEGGVQKKVSNGNAEANTGEKRAADDGPKENGDEPKKKKGRPAKGKATGAKKETKKRAPKKAATESGEPRRSGRNKS